MTRARASTAALLATSVLIVSALAPSPAHAAPGRSDTLQRFEATPSTLGAVPDAADGSTPGIRYVDVPVSGVAGPVTDVRLVLMLDHGLAGDVSVVLTAPDGASASVVDRVGVPAGTRGSTARFAGSYTFYDGASGNLESAAAAPATTVSPGDYAASTTDGSTTSLDTSLRAGDPDGTWRVRVADNGVGIAGSVTSASLVLASMPRSQSPLCYGATASASAARVDVDTAATTYAKAKARLKKARKHGTGPQVIRARKTLTRAKSARAGAQRELGAATAAQAAAC